MITPINGHILIEPIVHDSFTASQKDTYEEIGVVIDFDTRFELSSKPVLKKGCRVYFDSWMAAKFPNKEKEGEFLWLVKFEDVRAVEYD